MVENYLKPLQRLGISGLQGKSIFLQGKDVSCNGYMKNNRITIPLPGEYDHNENLVFLGRSDRENLFSIENEKILRAFRTLNGLLLVSIGYSDNSLTVTGLNRDLSKTDGNSITAYIRDWFDLDNDIQPFYKLAAKDKLLAPLVKKYFGLRLIGMPEVFEALAWAVIGQQINLSFAYTMKRRLVENFGESLEHEGKPYYIFPKPEVIASLSPDDLRPLQFSGKKAEYLIGISQKIAGGELDKDELLKLDNAEREKRLTSIRGIGKWTAHYVMMKSLHDYSALPVADVGLQNAIKLQLGLDAKPSEKEILQMAKKWKGWEAYATFYLWRSLY
jgi:DNA-3-methyladenine glycosylase II